LSGDEDWTDKRRDYAESLSPVTPAEQREPALPATGAA
jgi:hypothetical protein